jgi:hypothetical protein
LTTKKVDIITFHLAVAKKEKVIEEPFSSISLKKAQL